MSKDKNASQQDPALQQSPDQAVEADESSELSEDDKLKQAIAVQAESIGQLRTKLTVTVPAEIIAERTSDQINELRREAQIPGFRQGRAPVVLVEKRFGSDVQSDLKDKLVAQSYLAAVDKEGLQVLGEPDIDLESISLPDKGDLTYTCEVELKPQFELPPLKGIVVEKPAVSVTDELVHERLDQIRGMRGVSELVENQPAQENDQVVGRVEIKVADIVIYEKDDELLPVRPSLIDGIGLEKLGETLAGAKVGDTRQLTITLPDYYRQADYRGKEAVVAMTVGQIKRLVLPELDDEFAKQLGAGSAEELRVWVKADLEAGQDQMSRRAMRDNLHKYLLDNTTLDVPPTLSARQTDRAVARRMYDLLSRGVPQEEVDKRIDTLRLSAKEQVAQELKLHFILDKVAETLAIQVTEEEINARIAEIARAYNRRFDRVRDELIRRGGLESLYIDLRESKCVDQLLEQADIKDAPAAEEAKSAKKASKATKASSRKPPGKADDSAADET